MPCIQRWIFIFLGSELLSVQNNKSSIMLIPVINLLGSNFKIVLLVSTNTGVTLLFLVSYSIIQLLLIPVIDI